MKRLFSFKGANYRAVSAGEQRNSATSLGALGAIACHSLEHCWCLCPSMTTLGAHFVPFSFHKWQRMNDCLSLINCRLVCFTGVILLQYTLLNYTPESRGEQRELRRSCRSTLYMSLAIETSHNCELRLRLSLHNYIWGQPDKLSSLHWLFYLVSSTHFFLVILLLFD